MIIFELVGTEDHPAYERLAVENLDRQYDFCQWIANASIALGRPVFSLEIVKALNYHAISCLHVSAGQWRTCGTHHKRKDDTIHHYPDPHRVPSLMEMFVDEINRSWETDDPVLLAAKVLWKLNVIHPFINGNGRTARICCQFILSMKLNTWIGGDKLLPEMIKSNHAEYVDALRYADGNGEAGIMRLKPLYDMLVRLLNEQSLAENGAADIAVAP